MQCSFKKRKNRVSSGQTIAYCLDFAVKKTVPFGKAVYVCGNIPELGFWDPFRSFKLTWTQSNCWIGEVQLHKMIEYPIEFKFIVSDWETNSHSIFQWEVGKLNRIIQINNLRKHCVYDAEWNKQQIILCLHGPQDSENFYRYYVTGNHETLGKWKSYEQLCPISKETRQNLGMYFKTDPEFQGQANFSTCYTFAFSVNLDSDKINYSYLRKGDTYQREFFVGRSLYMDSRKYSQGQIKDIQWNGSRYVIDEPEFDQLLLQKLTSQLYLASNLKNVFHIEKVYEKRITTLVNINSIEEDYAINNYYISSLCKKKNIELQIWTVQELSSNKFVNEAMELIMNLESLLTNGHRVCLHCSKRLIKAAPIKLLYMTLWDGYSFYEAIQIIKNEISISETHCEIAKDVLQIVNNKIFRGKTQIKSH